MNTAVTDQKDKDVADIKSLQTETAGSLFLKGPATKTSEDVLRKLREDPLFQIRREEQAARDSMMANPLILARLKKKQEKALKKQSKKESKKEKKAMKKAKKLAKKASKKAAKSSSSSSSDDDGPPVKVPMQAVPQARARSRSPRREGGGSKKDQLDIKSLGPDIQTLTRREEYAQRVEERKR